MNSQYHQQINYQKILAVDCYDHQYIHLNKRKELILKKLGNDVSQKELLRLGKGKYFPQHKFEKN